MSRNNSKWPREQAFRWGDPRCEEMTAIIYDRKSTADEARSKSVARQEELNRADAEKYGFGKVLVINEEEGMKGQWWWRDPEGRNPGPWRDGLTKVVELLPRPDVGAVIVYKGNRLYRDNGICDALAKLFRQHGVHLIAGGRDVDLATARGMRDLANDAAAAAEWREQISEDIIADHQFKAEHGMFTRNPSCFGWKSRGPKSLTADPIWDQIDIAETMMKWLVGDGGEPPIGPYQVARRLTLQGISLGDAQRRRRADRPKHVDVSHVLRILTNCMFVGRWRHNGQEYECPRLLVSRNGEPPRPAISPELYDRVQDRLCLRRKKGGKSGCSGHLLAGLVVCGACGRPMHVHSAKRKNGEARLRYTCPYRLNPSRSCHGSSYASVLLPELDGWVIKYLAPIIASEIQAMRANPSTSAAAAELVKIENRLKALRVTETEKLSQLVEILDREQLASVSSRFRNERLHLQARAQELREIVDSETGRLAVDPDDLRSLAVPVLREALKRSVRWIAVTDKGVIVNTITSGLMAAAYEVPHTVSNRPPSRKLLPAVGAHASRVCSTWINDPTAFIAGMRSFLERDGDATSDQEILPAT